MEESRTSRRPWPWVLPGVVPDILCRSAVFAVTTTPVCAMFSASRWTHSGTRRTRRAIRLLARKTTEFSSDGLGSTHRTTITRTRVRRWWSLWTNLFMFRIMAAVGTQRKGWRFWLILMFFHRPACLCVIKRTVAKRFHRTLPAELELAVLSAKIEFIE